MPAPLDVDREAVRTLCVAIGIRNAARQMNLPEATVQSWSARGKWFKQPVQPPTVQRPLQPPAILGATTAITPATALQNELNGRKHKSRLLLSKFVVNAAKVASRSRCPLKDAQNVRHVAAVHSAIWPETPGTSGLSLQLGVFVGNVQ